MLHIKYKKTLSPFSDSEKQTHNVFRRFLSQEKESPPGNLIKSFSYKESTKVISSYYSLDNEKTQLSSKDYEEVIVNNNKIINIKHSNKSIPLDKV
jgi:predicted metal-dependent hydrolase